MTNGEMIGIGVGVVGLGVAGYALLGRRGSNQSAFGNEAPPVRLSAPPAPPSATQRAANDTMNTVGDVIQGVTSVISLFEGLFGGM